MGGKPSTSGRPRGGFPGVSTDDSMVQPAAHFGQYRPGGNMGLRSRSVSSVAAVTIDHNATGPFGFYTARGAADSDRADEGSRPVHPETGGGRHADGGLYLESRSSVAETLHLTPRWFSAHSGFKCPICSKSVASNEMEVHFIMCLSKPRLSYNDDVLARDAGECVICLEDLQQGETIARLPCLCIYHKSCIESWFEVNRSCPEHPSE